MSSSPEQSPSDTVLGPAHAIARALRDQDFTAFRSAVDDFIKTARVSAKEAKQALITTMLRKLRGCSTYRPHHPTIVPENEAKKVANELRSWTRRLLLLDFGFAQLDEEIYKSMPSQKRFAAAMRQSREPTGGTLNETLSFYDTEMSWLTSRLMVSQSAGGSNGTGSDNAEPEAPGLEELMLRWRFWLDVFGGQLARLVFGAVLAPEYGSVTGIDSGLGLLFGIVTAKLREGQASLALEPYPNGEEDEDEDQDSSQKKRSRHQDNQLRINDRSEIEVIPSLSRLRDLKLTGRSIGYTRKLAITLDRSKSYNAVLAKPDAQLEQLPRPYLSRGTAGSDLVERYVTLDIFIPVRLPLDDRPALAKLRHHFQVRDNMEDRMLLGYDMVVQHSMFIDPIRHELTVTACQGGVAELICQTVMLPQVVEDQEDVRERMDSLREKALESHQAYLQKAGEQL